MKRLGLLALALLLVPASLLARGRNEHDDDFVEAMIVHHQQALDLERFAVAKAGHAELRRLAQKMIDEQKSDIKQLEPLRDHGETAPEIPKIDLVALAKKSGKDLDLAILRAMIEQRSSTISLAGHEDRHGADSEVQQLARTIAAKQRAEREVLRGWLRDWK